MPTLGVRLEASINQSKLAEVGLILSLKTAYRSPSPYSDNGTELSLTLSLLGSSVAACGVHYTPASASAVGGCSTSAPSGCCATEQQRRGLGPNQPGSSLTKKNGEAAHRGAGRVATI